MSANLFSIDKLKPFYKGQDTDMKVNDIFSYKNKIVVQISFRAIYKDVQFLQDKFLI